ncbi:MAG: DUF262 domain-containing protein, partial [Verrucomicrobiota bacterium]|nr:DUF262 domain-containing protein [Verrucomicrobiota bacterium]
MPVRTLSSGSNIEFATLGIGEVITRYRLRVPLHQRQYAWTEKEVREFFTDIGGAIQKAAYFLGTIVLTGGSESAVKDVSDGQQRLATTVILLSAIRDYYHKAGEMNRVKSIENSFLFTYDDDTAELEPKLTLNSDDNHFFGSAILPSPEDRADQISPK